MIIPSYFPVLAACLTFIAMMLTLLATIISEFWIKPRRDKRGFSRLLYGELKGYTKYFDADGHITKLSALLTQTREDRKTFFLIFGSPNLQGNTVFDKIADKLGMFDNDVLSRLALLYHVIEGFRIRLQNLSRPIFLEADDSVHIAEIELLISILQENKAIYDMLLIDLKVMTS